MFKWPSSIVPSILKAVIFASLLAIGGSIAAAILVRVNARLDADTPWAAPLVLFMGFAAARAFGRSDASGREQVGVLRLASTSVALATALGLLAIGLSSIFGNQEGAATLPGDRLVAPPYFQNIMSFATLAAGAIFEETAVRGQIQFRLMQELGAVPAEIVAGVAFVLLHFLRFESWQEVVFLVALATITGRIAFWANSVVWPITVHLGANLIVAGGVLYLRG